MPALTPEQKIFIVTRLACFDTPGIVLKAWKEHYPNVPAPSRVQVSGYDADTVNGKKMSKELRELFKNTRKRLLKNWQDIPVANKGVRLRILNGEAMKALEKGNTAMVASLLEQSAKEAGEAFSNRHHIDLKAKVDTNSMSDVDLQKALNRFGIQATTLPVAEPASNGKEGDDAGS